MRKFLDNSDPVARRETMRTFVILAAALLTLSLTATAQKNTPAAKAVSTAAASPAPAPTAPAATPASATAPAAPAASAAAMPLTAEDLNALLDGYMPYALHTGHITSAGVAVVKHVQIYT